MTSPVSIRLARPADAPTLARLIDQSVRSLGSRSLSEALMTDALRHVFGLDAELLADRTYYLAEVQGRLAGAGGWSRRRTFWNGGHETSYLLDPAVDAARLRAFYIHPLWARSGIGSRLLVACEVAARQAGFRRLELVTTESAEPLYAAFGFDVVERSEIPLPEGLGIPVARMEKALVAAGTSHHPLAA